MRKKHLSAAVLILSLLLTLALPAYAAGGRGIGTDGIVLPSMPPIPSLPPIIVDTQIAVTASNFPDAAFRAYLLDSFENTGGLYPLMDSTQVTAIECAGLDIQSLKGVELFPQLAYLDCCDNALSSLDLSQNTLLTALYCAGNGELASLDVREIPALLDTAEHGALSEEDGVLCFTGEAGELVIDLTTALVGFHILRFDPDGGEGEFPPQLVRDGARAVCPDAEPERGNDWFLGWFLDGEPYDWEQPVTQSLTLTAGWAAPCTVTLDCAGGELDGESERTLALRVGLTLRGRLPVPVWEGKYFAGWLLDGEPVDPDAPLSGDVTLVASWRDAFSLRFDRSNPHDDGARPIPALTVPADEPGEVSFWYERYGTQPAALHDDGDWQFVGWDFDPDTAPDAVAFPRYQNGADAPLAGPYSVTLTGDMTLYAIYGKAPVLTVMKNDGSDETADGVVRTPGCYSRLMIGSTPRREDYELLGYSRDPNAAVPDEGLARLDPNRTNYVYYYAAADTTLYAVWGEKQYTLRFDGNGGVSWLPGELSFSMSSKPEIVLPGTESVFKSHRLLLGWAVILSANWDARIGDVDFGKTPPGAVYLPGSVLPADCFTANDLTVYAVWQYEPIVVSLDPTGLADYPLAERYPLYYNYGADKAATAAGAPTGHPATPDTSPAAKPFPEGFESVSEDETVNRFAAWLDQDGAVYAPYTISNVRNGTALLPNDRDTELLAVWQHTFVRFLYPDGSLYAFHDFVFDPENPAPVHTLTAPEEPYMPGCCFLGWAEETSGLRYQAGEEIVTKGELCFRALLIDLNTPDCVLPAALGRLEDEALAGTAFRYVELRGGLTALPARLFADCEKLLAVGVPPSVTQIDPAAFDGAPASLLLLGEPGSVIEAYAASCGFAFLEVAPGFFS